MENSLCLNRFDGIVYINLDHRTDRKEELLQELDRLKVDPTKVHRIDPVFDLLNGHRGCALNHAKALEYAEKKKWKNALILEDDFVMTRDAESGDEIIDHFFKMMGNDWDVFMLGGNIKGLKKTPLPPRIHQVVTAQCAHAYAVNAHYLKTLKTLFLYAYERMKDDPFFFISEQGNLLDQLWDHLMRQDRWYCVEIFAQQRPSFSDIRLADRSRVHREQF